MGSVQRRQCDRLRDRPADPRNRNAHQSSSSGDGRLPETGELVSSIVNLISKADSIFCNFVRPLLVTFSKDIILVGILILY
ncbi:unnamed protein product, partial [Nesidiocoris tenuis]